MEIEMKKENMCKKKEIETISEREDYEKKRKKRRKRKKEFFTEQKRILRFLAFIHNPVKTNKM